MSPAPTASPDMLAVLTVIEMLLYGIFFVLLFILVIGIAWLRVTRQQLKLVVKAQEIKQFQAQASVLLAEAQYDQLKQICSERLERSPGDASAYYYLGICHFRCREYVEAKRRFDALVKLDATWKKVAASHLEEIEVALKKSKPMLVDGDR